MPRQFPQWVAAAVAVTVLGACARSPESTVKHFYNAVAEGEITEAQGCISSQIVGMLGPQKLSAALAKESQRIQGCGGIKSIDVDLTGTGELRMGTANITYRGNCAPKREDVKLIKEDGKWKFAPSK